MEKTLEYSLCRISFLVIDTMKKLEKTEERVYYSELQKRILEVMPDIPRVKVAGMFRYPDLESAVDDLYVTASDDKGLYIAEYKELKLYS